MVKPIIETILENSPGCEVEAAWFEPENFRHNQYSRCSWCDTKTSGWVRAVLSVELLNRGEMERRVVEHRLCDSCEERAEDELDVIFNRVKPDAPG